MALLKSVWFLCFRPLMKSRFVYLWVVLLGALPFIQSCQVGKGQANDDSQLDSSYARAKAYYDSIDFHREAILSSSRTRKIQKGLAHFYDHVLGPRFNGSMLVAHKGVIIFEKHKGYADFGQNTPITKNTTFQLASTSKPFTAMGILYLRKQGKLKLTDSVQRFFPAFPYHGVTIQNMLNHRSGLPKYLYFSSIYWEDMHKLMSNQDVIDMMIQFRPDPIFPPNRRYNYTNTNYVILGAIIQKVTGMSLNDFFKKAFFEPLGMKHTYVYNPNTGQPYPNRSRTYDYRSREIENECFDGVVGDKNVYSTAEDLFKWSQALYPGHLFTEAELADAFTPYSNEYPGIKNYGLGWHLLCYPDSTKVVYHNGWWHGNTSSFYRFIGDSTTLIILSNRFNKKVYEVEPLWKLMDVAAYASES